MPGGWVWQNAQEWPQAGGTSPFVQMQRWQQAQQWGPPNRKKQGSDKQFWAEQFPGYKVDMVPGTCPSWTCTNKACKVVCTTAKPKPKTTSPTGYQCHLCGEPRPISTTWWALEVFGGPGLRQQKYLDQQAKNKKQVGAPAAAAPAPAAKAEVTTAPLSAKAKKRAKALAPKDFSIPAAVCTILGDLGELPGQQEIPLNEESDSEWENTDDLEPATAVKAMEGIENSAKQELLATMEAATKTIADTLKALGKEEKNTTDAAEQLLAQVHVQMTPTAEKTPAPVPVVTKPETPSTISGKLVILQAEKAKTFKHLEEVKALREQQLLAKDQALQRISDERQAIADAFEAELHTLKEVLASLEEGARKLDAQLANLHAPTTPRNLPETPSPWATRTRNIPYTIAAVAPLTTMRCTEGYQAFTQLASAMQLQGSHEGAQAMLFHFLDGLQAKAQEDFVAKAGAPSKRGRASVDMGGASQGPQPNMVLSMMQTTTHGSPPGSPLHIEDLSGDEAEVAEAAKPADDAA